jgi:hypothetical protein
MWKTSGALPAGDSVPEISESLIFQRFHIVPAKMSRFLNVERPLGDFYSLSTDPCPGDLAAG